MIPVQIKVPIKVTAKTRKLSPKAAQVAPRPAELPPPTISIRARRATPTNKK